MLLENEVIFKNLSFSQTKDCNTQVLQIMRYTISQVNFFFDILYSHGVFLPQSASQVAKTAAFEICVTWPTILPKQNDLQQCFLTPCFAFAAPNGLTKEGYSQLAGLAFQQNLKLFKWRPKVHMMYEKGMLLSGTSPTLNPMAVACWSDEDYIGRVSRISRACHGLTCSIATMRKALGNYQIQMDRFASKKR